MKRPPAATDPAAAALHDRLTGVQWRLLPFERGTAAWNMAVDEALLDAAAREDAPPTLRFYGWSPPSVSLGHFQRPEDVDLAYAAERGFSLVRRATGGRGVLHQHEVTYSVVLPPSVVGGAGVRTSYAVLTRHLNAALRRLVPPDLESALSSGAGGCDARSNRTANCFALAAECDAVTPAGKLVGSAQVRRHGALLQHGSILLDAEPEAWERLFGEPGALATLSGLAGRPVGAGEVVDVILAELREAGITLCPGGLTPVELDLAENSAAVRDGGAS
ncbi:MAG: biotin/lipoate protein ligase [Armatimonadetes bacterium]|nr:biotin/lipoate protein ligase [Armatimonadota bacterium]